MSPALLEILPTWRSSSQKKMPKKKAKAADFVLVRSTGELSSTAIDCGIDLVFESCSDM